MLVHALAAALVWAAPADTVTGVVTAEAGTPVANAIVQLKRVRAAALTDHRGRYRIVTPDGARGTDTLVVEGIGFATASVPLALADGRTLRVDVRLGLEPVALDEIVVTGTAGNQERRAQAAVVASLGAADILARAPVANVAQMLQTRIPGLTITETSGTSGAAARINIRGAASISLSNRPLVFVDGVRVDGGPRSLVNVSGASSVGQAPSALNDLNPADIESIEVVKGPAAATLYGADASAGVIQIITKKGLIGNRDLVQEIVLEYDRIDPNFEVPTNWARCVAAVTGPASTNPLCRGREVGTVVSDNPAVRVGAFRAGRSGEVRYTARGGGPGFGWFASLGIREEDGTTPNNRLGQRWGRASFTVMPASTLSVDASFALSHSEHELPRSDQDAYGYYIQSVLGSPLTVREGPSGTTGGLLFPASSLESLSSIESRVSTLRATPIVEVRFDPTGWLTNRLTVGADLARGRGFQHFPRNDFGWYPTRLPAGNGDVATTEEDARIYTVDYAGSVRTTFHGGALTSDLAFGSQYIRRVVDLLSGAGAGLASNVAPLVDNAAVSTVAQASAETRSHGLFVQEQLGWRDRVYLQVGLRADRNSAFGSEVGTFYLPKVGVSWVVSEEAFWRPFARLAPTLRLRGAWGTTGRSPASGASLRTYLPARYVTNSGALELGLVPGDPGNPDLRPERGEELELGLDVSLFGGRLGAELTWYEKTTEDLLVAVPSAPSSGFARSPLGNIGEVRNRGLELALEATPIDERSHQLRLSLAASTLHNEIVDLGTVGAFVSDFRAFVPGRQVGAWWVHRIRSVDAAGGRVVVSDTAEFAGNQLPTFQASVAAALRLRSLHLNALAEHKAGYVVWNASQEFRDRSSRTSADVVLGPERGGYDPVARLERLGPYVSERSGAPVGAGSVRQPYLQKGDHVRVREISVSAPLPAWMLERLRVADATLTVGARNVALWAPDYEGDDPDVLGAGANASGVNQLFNVDVFTAPPVRRWTVRVSARF